MSLIRHRSPLLSGLTALALCFLPFEVPAESDVQNGGLRNGGLRNGGAETASIGCNAGLRQAGDLNSIEILKSGASCLERERYLDATFLLILGQIRGATDISLFPPASYQGAELVYGLAARVTYNPRSDGGFGHSEV